jgi:hypothetical protein
VGAAGALVGGAGAAVLHALARAATDPASKLAPAVRRKVRRLHPLPTRMS